MDEEGRQLQLLYEIIDHMKDNTAITPDEGFYTDRGSNSELYKGTVTRRIKDCDGNPVGKRATNPVLDTRQYEVEFQDGSVETYTANLIAENIYSQVDEEGRYFQMINSTRREVI